MTTCPKPPRGWTCTRKAGHPGPCPTVPRRWNLTRFARRVRRGIAR